MKKYSTFFATLLIALIVMPATALAAEAETWTSLGVGKFRESFLHAFYQIAAYPEVDVEIQECDQVPGRYRIVDPYKDFPNFIGTPGCRPDKTGLYLCQCLRSQSCLYRNLPDRIHRR